MGTTDRTELGEGVEAGTNDLEKVPAVRVQTLEDTRRIQEGEDVFFHLASVIENADTRVVIENRRYEVGPHGYGFSRDKT